jgi:hypothetical protein
MCKDFGHGAQQKDITYTCIFPVAAIIFVLYGDVLIMAPQIAQGTLCSLQKRHSSSISGSYMGGFSIVITFGGILSSSALPQITASFAMLRATKVGK